MTSTPERSSPLPVTPLEARHQAMLNSIVQESADCIKVLDMDARLLSMNSGGQQTMEIDDFSVCQNLLWPDFWAGEDRLQVEAALDRARLGERSTFEGQTATFKGTPKWWEVRVAPLLDEHGAVHQLLAISRDITARKQAELALSALNADLERQVQIRTRQALQDIQAQQAFMLFTETVGVQTDVAVLATEAIEVLQGRFKDASIGYYKRDQDLWKAQVWSGDLPPEVVAAITAGLPSEHPIIAEVLGSRQVVFKDVDAEVSVVAPAMYRAVGSVPLMLDGEVFGLLSVGLRTTPAWQDQDQILVRAVGRALNLALERAEDLRQLAERSTELETLNSVLNRERTFLRAVLQSMSEGLVACDEYGQLTLFNEATRTFHGQDASTLPPEEWAGHYDLFESDGVTALTTEQVPLYRAWNGETLHDVEMVIQPSQGNMRHLLASGGPMFSPDGQPLGAVVTMRDVTVRRAAEQQLAHSNEQLTRSNAELRAANEELEAFAYSASHDLRTPIRHVQSFSELARKELAKLPEDNPVIAGTTRYLGFVEQAAGRMSTLIDAMLHLSRSTRQALTVERVALERLVNRARADQDGTQPVEWRLGPLPEVQGDPALLQQVMDNLLSNAVKFSRTTEQALIEVWGEEEAFGWTVFVRDNGVGFEEKYKNRLFGVFQRLHTDREFEGTGVGLATVRRIILRHGGSVNATSTPGQGATFSFTLPRERST